MSVDDPDLVALIKGANAGSTWAAGAIWMCFADCLQSREVPPSEVTEWALGLLDAARAELGDHLGTLPKVGPGRPVDIESLFCKLQMGWEVAQRKADLLDVSRLLHCEVLAAGVPRYSDTSSAQRRNAALLSYPTRNVTDLEYCLRNLR